MEIHNHHTIGKQVVLLQLPRAVNAFDLQQQASMLFWEAVAPALEALFDRYASTDELISIEKLHVDVGLLSEKNWEQTFPKRVLECVEEALRQQLNKVGSVPDITRQPLRTGHFLQWLHFLEFGYLPWNATTWDGDEALQKSVLDTLASETDALQQLHRLLARHATAFDRLLMQHPEAFLKTLTAVFTARPQEDLLGFRQEWAATMRALKKNTHPVSPAISTWLAAQAFEHPTFFWRHILEMVILERQQLAAPALIRSFLERIAPANQLSVLINFIGQALPDLQASGQPLEAVKNAITAFSKTTVPKTTGTPKEAFLQKYDTEPDSENAEATAPQTLESMEAQLVDERNILAAVEPPNEAFLEKTELASDAKITEATARQILDDMVIQRIDGQVISTAIEPMNEAFLEKNETVSEAENAEAPTLPISEDVQAQPSAAIDISTAAKPPKEAFSEDKQPSGEENIQQKTGETNQAALRPETGQQLETEASLLPVFPENASSLALTKELAEDFIQTYHEVGDEPEGTTSKEIAQAASETFFKEGTEFQPNDFAETQAADTQQEANGTSSVHPPEGAVESQAEGTVSFVENERKAQLSLPENPAELSPVANESAHQSVPENKQAATTERVEVFRENGSPETSESGVEPEANPVYTEVAPSSSPLGVAGDAAEDFSWTNVVSETTSTVESGTDAPVPLADGVEKPTGASRAQTIENETAIKESPPSSPLEVLPETRGEGAALREINMQPRPAPKRSPLEVKPGTTLFIHYAGMVLLHPYLLQFFKGLGLVEGKNFKGDACQHRAVHLLHYIVTKQTGLPEFVLLLPKLLCGLPFEEPMERYLEFSEMELEECENLLRAIIQHWGALGSASPDGLREAFLRRDGKLEMRENGWQLTVERQTIDILLGKLPWGLGIIKLPWMPEMLKVEWG
jgi:Contractile injection system tape measure protein